MNEELFLSFFQLVIFFGVLIYICVLAIALLRWLWRLGNKK